MEIEIIMTFGEKFREKHQDLEKRIKSKEYLDSYAKELKGMVYCHDYDDKHYFFTKDHSFTKEQIDYLQLKLDIAIRRSENNMLYVNPFEPCELLPHPILPVVLAIVGMTLFLVLGCPVCLKLCSGLPKLAQGFLEFLVVLVSVAIPVGIMFLFFKIDEARYVEKLKNSKEL